MPPSIKVAVLLSFLTVFLISAGVGSRSISPYAPLLGCSLGIISLFLAGHYKGVLEEKEKTIRNEKENSPHV